MVTCLIQLRLCKSFIYTTALTPCSSGGHFFTFDLVSLLCSPIAGETVHAGLRAHKYWTAGYFTETQKGDKALGLSESKHIFQSCKNKNKNKTKTVNVFTGRRHNDNAKKKTNRPRFNEGQTSAVFGVWRKRRQHKVSKDSSGYSTYTIYYQTDQSELVKSPTVRHVNAPIQRGLDEDLSFRSLNVRRKIELLNEEKLIWEKYHI